MNVYSQARPDAIEDTGTTDEDTQLSNLLISENDTADVGRNIVPSTIILINPTTGSTTTHSGGELVISGEGSYSINSSGELTFDPVSNFNGTSIIHYTIEDNGGLISDTAVVTITVDAVNDLPEGVDDNYNVLEGDTLDISAPGVLGNDTDEEGDGLIAELVSTVSHGELTLNPDGSFEYIHDGSETALDSFIYRPNDGSQGSVATVRISITPVNDPPISNDDIYIVSEGATLTIDTIEGVLANDTDPDDDIEAVVVSNPRHGTLQLNDDGSFIYEHDGSESTLDSFTYVATDGEVDGNVATARITIRPVNDPPYFENLTQVDLYEGSDTSEIVLSNYAKDDDTPTQELTFSLTSLSVNLNVYIIEDTLFISPKDSNWFGTDEVFVTINDNDTNIQGITEDTILVNVTNVDDYPEFTVDTIHVPATLEDEDVYEISLYTIEIDDDSLILEMPDDPIFSFSNNNYLNNYYIQAEVPENWYGERYFTFYIVDNTPQQLKDSIVLHYHVIPVDDPPYVEDAISDIFVLEDSDSLTINLYNVFEDIDNPDTEMDFSIYNSNSNIADAYINSNLLIIKFLENKNTSGSYGLKPLITVTCSSNGENVNDQFYVTVFSVNDPPSFTTSGDVIIWGNEHQEIGVTVYPDPVPIDESGIVTYSLVPPSVEFAEVSIDPNLGKVTIIVEEGAVGSQGFEIIAVEYTEPHAIARQSFQLSVNELANQTIDFDSIPDKSLLDSIVILEATATSGLTVSFSITEGAASISNDTLFVLGAGQIVVKASQGGNEYYNPAPDTSRSFYVEKLTQEIDFEEIPDKTYGDADFTLHASSTSGLNVGFNVDYGPISIINDTIVRIDGVGEAKITAYQNGDQIYSADNVTQIFNIQKDNQTIDFETLENSVFSLLPITLSATSSSGLPVSFAVLSGPAYNNGSYLYLTGSGYVTVRAIQTGNGYYNPATEVDQTIEIFKANQTMTFDSIPDQTYGSDYILLNTSTSSDLPVEFLIQEGPVILKDDSLLNMTGAGNVTISVFQSGDNRYYPTDTITRNFEIKKAIQYIDLDEPGSVIFGIEGIGVSASASSGLDINFEIVSGPATVEDSIITPYDYGEVVFRIIQGGNENYKSASIEYKIEFVKSVYDVSVGGLLSPKNVAEVKVHRPIVVIVRIKNIGNRDIEGFDIFYAIDSEDDNNIMVSEHYPGTLYSGDSLDYSFSSIWTPREANNELCVYIQSINDTIFLNDTIKLDLKSTLTVPYTANSSLIEYVYPNPANDFVYFSLGKFIKDGTLVIYNSNGTLVKQLKIETLADKLTIEVDVNQFKQGAYYYNFIHENEYTSGKFVVY